MIPKGSRYKLGNIFRVTGATVQPATLPFDERGASAEIRDLEANNSKLVEDAIRGEKVLASACAGGHARLGTRKGPADDVLRAEVAKLMEAGESRTNACLKVGRTHRLSRSTVYRRTRS